MIRKLFFFVVYLASTLAFVVLFESGIENYPQSFQAKLGEIQSFITGDGGKPKPTKL